MTRAAGRWVIIAGVGAAVGGLAWFVAAGVVPNVFPKRFALVSDPTPGEPGDEVYRSGLLTPAALRRVVERHGIRTIVDLRGFSEGPDGLFGDDASDDAFAQDLADSLAVRRVNPSHGGGLYGDGRGDPRNYVEALQVLRDPSARPVLIHCAAGTQRTGVAVCLFRTLIERSATETEAVAEARRYGYDPSDNPHFEVYLREHAGAIGAGLGGASGSGS